MYWANFLHFYQPPTQKPFWIHKITTEAYRPILKGIKENGDAKLTLNISGILLEQLDQYGEDDVIDLIKDLLKEKRIELTGSAKYHPLLPFLPEDEVIRQIKLNEETLKNYFGDLWEPQGFFPPEMGFNCDVAKIVAKLGYKWIIVDELSFPRDKKPIDYSKLYSMEGLPAQGSGDDFYIHFRERKMSWTILSGQVGTGDLLLKGLENRLDKNEYLLTAMDGETFGHHRPGLEHLLFEIYGNRGISTILVSDLPKYFKDKVLIKPEPSTWALMDKDLEENKPFNRWIDEDNEIHKLQWELTNLALESIKKSDKKDLNYVDARSILDRALHSDQYWWASARPWWSIEMIERGAKELSNAILRMPGIDMEIKEKAKRLYKYIIFTAFDWQREGVVDALAHKEDEDIRQRTDENVPQLPKEEIDKMVANLEKELEIIVKKQEFERAAQIRDRIAELKRYGEDRH
ncbi:UvrB/UvrC motif-containing protein [Patescibacteria group bacterium]|nr:UvrB/UvrC motif-containing protein [Patescibacteria group bacterium]